MVKKDIKNEEVVPDKAESLEDKKKKAPRRPKFKAEERAYLVKLVNEKKGILETKCTSRDIKDITKKALTWREVTAQFNSGCIVLMLVESIIKGAMNPVKCEFDSDSSLDLSEDGPECPSTPITSLTMSTPASSKRKLSLEVKTEVKRQKNSPASSSHLTLETLVFILFFTQHKYIINRKMSRDLNCK